MDNFLNIFLIVTTIISLLVSLIVFISVYKISEKNRLLIYKNPFTPNLSIRKLASIYFIFVIFLSIGFNLYFFLFL